MNDSYYTQWKRSFPNDKTHAEIQAEKYPVKHGRDFGPRFTINNLIEGLADLINRGAPVRTQCDYLDEHFLFGAWGYELKHIVAGECLMDLRVAIVAAYKIGVEHGTKKTPKF